jgi:monovalent cation/proton antiporter MnhG/PhaG subunit
MASLALLQLLLSIGMLHMIIISEILMLLGATLTLLSAYKCTFGKGDLLTKLHIAGMGDSGGVTVIAIGAAIHYGWNMQAVKVILLFFGLLIANPVTTYYIAKTHNKSEQ